MVYKKKSKWKEFVGNVLGLVITLVFIIVGSSFGIDLHEKIVGWTWAYNHNFLDAPCIQAHENRIISIGEWGLITICPDGSVYHAGVFRGQSKRMRDDLYKILHGYLK